MKQLIIGALEQLRADAEEFGDLDAALGDGDLGVTVASGAVAVIERLRALNADTTPSDTIRDAAIAFGSANPSTFSALVQGALLQSSTVNLSGLSPIEALQAVLDASASSIAANGRTAPGDKTVLDPLLAVSDELREQTELSPSVYVNLARVAAERTNQLKSSVSLKGRAAWLRDRSIGLADPGSVVLVRFFEALADQNPPGPGDNHGSGI